MFNMIYCLIYIKCVTLYGCSAITGQQDSAILLVFFCIVQLSEQTVYFQQQSDSSNRVHPLRPHYFNPLVVVVCITCGSFRVNSTNFDKSSQVSVSNIAQKIPKITLVSIMKACQILGCNSEYFWRYSLSNFLFCFAFLPSRL